ncbi:hypothetical protein RJ641_024125 [Dillenia turbinata]|uniref:Uncharacterized protein n=1 Tax=Dillenia turbinata TaxID=194707 RepID=A0AAN8YTE7_9MAGN
METETKARDLDEMDRPVYEAIVRNDVATFFSTGLPEMVKLLLNQRWLLDSEEDGVQVNSLQIAASRGHSIIPFQRKALMRLLVIAHKLMWVAVSFMATAFVAATWLILPPVKTDWTIEAILPVSVAADNG